MTPTSAHRSRPIHRHAILLSVFGLFCLAGVGYLSAQEPKAPEIPPLAAGRYILITQGDAALDPAIFAVVKTKDGYSLIPEDSQFAETTITADEGNYIFQLTRKGNGTVPERNQNWPKKFLLSFAGAPSESNLRALSGTFSSIYYYYGQDDSARMRGEPGGNLGKFLLFPVDKAK